MDKMYYCDVCYKNHQDPFVSGLVKDLLDNYCHKCNNHSFIEMSLTDEEFEIIKHLSPDKILSIDKLKKDESNKLSNQEFVKILSINPDNDFILAMNRLKATDIIDFNLKLSQMTPIKSSKEDDVDISFLLKENISNVPKCPTCGSPNIKKISATKRWVGTGLFGLASSDIGKTMQCENCGYKW